MKTLFYALDLEDDPALISEYEEWHRSDKIWPEVVSSLRQAGIQELEILRTGNRLIMVMATTENYDASAKAEADEANPAVVAWEELMCKFQRPLPWAQPDQKWVPMNSIFRLSAC